ncbi:hypothetical protein Tco_0328371 [Tanacetum coccineum]
MSILWRVLGLLGIGKLGKLIVEKVLMKVREPAECVYKSRNQKRPLKKPAAVVEKPDAVVEKPDAVLDKKSAPAKKPTSVVVQDKDSVVVNYPAELDQEKDKEKHKASAKEPVSIVDRVCEVAKHIMFHVEDALKNDAIEKASDVNDSDALKNTAADVKEKSDGKDKKSTVDKDNDKALFQKKKLNVVSKDKPKSTVEKASDVVSDKPVVKKRCLKPPMLRYKDKQRTCHQEDDNKKKFKGKSKKDVSDSELETDVVDEADRKIKVKKEESDDSVPRRLCLKELKKSLLHLFLKGFLEIMRKASSAYPVIMKVKGRMIRRNDGDWKRMKEDANEGDLFGDNSATRELMNKGPVFLPIVNAVPHKSKSIKKRVVKPSPYMLSPYMNKKTNVVPKITRSEFILGNSVFAMQGDKIVIHFESHVILVESQEIQRESLVIHFESHTKSMFDGTLATDEAKWDSFSNQVKSQFGGNVDGLALQGIDLPYWKYGNDYLDNKSATYVGKYKEVCVVLKYIRLENSHEIPKKSPEIQYESPEIQYESPEIQYESLEIPFESFEIP